MTLLNCIKEVCEEEELEFRSDYSGRGMYGEICIGVVGSDVQEIIKSILHKIVDYNTDDNPDYLHNLIEEIMNYRIDNMGRDMIVYWPEFEDI